LAALAAAMPGAARFAEGFGAKPKGKGRLLAGRGK
jgi:hypothetical protein